MAVGVIITKCFKDESSLGQQLEVADHCGILAVNLTMKIIGNFYNTETGTDYKIQSPWHFNGFLQCNFSKHNFSANFIAINSLLDILRTTLLVDVGKSSQCTSSIKL